jgi:hypothetical protein
VRAGCNFEEVLAQCPAIIDMMDFLEEETLVKVARAVLADVASKPFPLTNPMCVKILLEMSQVLYQSLTVFTPPDVVREINKEIEWFLYRVDFGANVAAHVQFLQTARASFPGSDIIAAALSYIVFRLAAASKVRRGVEKEQVVRVLMAYALVTIPSIKDLQKRAKLFLQGASVALVCGSAAFAHQFYDELARTLAASPLDASTLQMYIECLNFLLVMPAKPSDADPF